MCFTRPLCRPLLTQNGFGRSRFNPTPNVPTLSSWKDIEHQRSFCNINHLFGTEGSLFNREIHRGTQNTYNPIHDPIMTIAKPHL
uniref:Uncharacterized protein n=1 Tax=Brassica oleracea TaxID=3712 RepID=A0A3P6FJE1_BRAOL|nr:unnamed protein product [Brassica oleracea]